MSVIPGLEKICAAFHAKKDDSERKKIAKTGSVVITRDIFKFHAHDTRAQIAEKFQARLKNIFSGAIN